MKLGIALPLAGRLYDKEFWISFMMMDKPDYTLLLPRVEVYNFAADIAGIRNDLVKQALDEGIDRLFMMDTDQVYPVGTVKQMLSHDMQVVSAPVHRRYPPFDVIMLRGEIGKYIHVSEDEIYSGKLVEVDATGTGCICFDMSIFKDFDPPWFEIKIGSDGNPIGEDIGFCSRLRKAGVKIYVDTSVEVDHMATMMVNKQTYHVFKKLNGYEWRQQGDNFNE